MRSPANNPFVPGSDRVPEIWAGRALELADWRDVLTPRRLAGVYERGRIVVGEFGIGKSVLVNRIATEASEAGHWVAGHVRVPVGADALALVAESIREVAAGRDLDARIGRRAGGLLQRVEELTLPAIGGGVKLRPRPADPNAYRTVLRLLIEVATLAQAAGRLLVLRIDEVQNVAAPGPLSQLLTVLGDALEATTTAVDIAGLQRDRVLPLAVYLSGLPDVGRKAGAAGATFSRRLRALELEPLDEQELRTGLAPFASEGWPVLAADGPDRVVMEPAGIDLVVDRCVGDPFLFQLAGEAAWNAGTGAVITVGEVERGWRSARREVLRYVEARLEGLTEPQLAYLNAAAALDDGDRTAASIARALDRASSTEIASTTRSLDVHHALIRRSAGRITFRSRALQAHLRGHWP